MNLTPEIVTGVALGAAAVYCTGVLWSSYRQRVEAAKLLARKEPTVTEPKKQNVVDPHRFRTGDMDHDYQLRKDLPPTHPARRPIGAASAENRRPPTPGTVQAFRTSDDNARRRRDEEDEARRSDNFTTGLIVGAALQSSETERSHSRSEPVCSPPSYDDSSSSRNSSSSGSCSGSWGGSDSSSSSSSSDSGSCGGGCD